MNRQESERSEESLNRREQRRIDRANRRIRTNLRDRTYLSSSTSQLRTSLSDDMMTAVPRSVATLSAHSRTRAGDHQLREDSDSGRRILPGWNGTRSVSTGDYSGFYRTPSASLDISHTDGISPSTTLPISATTTTTATSSTSVAAGYEGEMQGYRKDAQLLKDAAGEKGSIDTTLIRDLLTKCQSAQEGLQFRLNAALEESDAIDNLEDLFALNDVIFSAIEAGNAAIEREKAEQNKLRQDADDGPTITVLAENEDVFSLICMLRAPDEKKMESAVALMTFARDNESLRKEIRSSGGMHSFLTLFRAKTSNRELKVISSLAVAFILPSFVASSQTSATIGLRIMECLQYLAASEHIDLRHGTISRFEIQKAASMGVNVLWTNAIQPLLFAPPNGDEEKQRENQIMQTKTFTRLLKLRGKSAGEFFERSKEAMEIQELTELAVTLIVQMTKNIQSSSRDLLDVGYNIVEQVCEVDVARPLVVREGLLETLLEWIQSNDMAKVQPATSALRHLIAIEDRYLAGWIHSQIASEGGISKVVNLLNESISHDTRTAVAQILSSLCMVPYTRAAAVEARCIGYLVAMLYEHSAQDSKEMVLYAANALLYLASGAMRIASSSSPYASDMGNHSDQQERILTEMLDGWAHTSFVQIILTDSNRLKSISVEALRVLSEDIDDRREMRSKLCNVGAGEAFGTALRDHCSNFFIDTESTEMAVHHQKNSISLSFIDGYEALCGLSNIFEIKRESSKSSRRIVSGELPLDAKEMRIKGSIGLVKSGGLNCILRLAMIPYEPIDLSANHTPFSVNKMDLVHEAFRVLANVSPLLLTDAAAQEYCTIWTSSIFGVLHKIVMCYGAFEDHSFDNLDLLLNSLKGLGALAHYDPLKSLIVARTLTKIVDLNNRSEGNDEISSAASQTLLSLGFTEDRITVQKAANDPKLLVDWFCLERCLLLQAMARVELRNEVEKMWELAYEDVDAEIALKLARRSSAHSSVSSMGSFSDTSEDSPVMKGLFEHFTTDRESQFARNKLLKQFESVYRRNALEDLDEFDCAERNLTFQSNLLESHSFPLHDPLVEKNWILSHSEALESNGTEVPLECRLGTIPSRIVELLDSCFPSQILRSNIIPFYDIRTEASFDFRALMMPQRRYFSFAREGRLLIRLCEKEAESSGSDETHWSLGFTNSLFAGEFVQSLVQTLYLCPMITGLSFAKQKMSQNQYEGCFDNDDDEYNNGDLLATLAGSLPPWVSELTFDGVLRSEHLNALVRILEMMGKLSSAGEVNDTVEESQFSCIALRNLKDVSLESWESFFRLCGNSTAINNFSMTPPLSSLKILDLSGNNFGDEAAAQILEAVYTPLSCCQLKQLDLSGNAIGRGSNVVRVLRSHADNVLANRHETIKASSLWTAPLHTLVLADNNLASGAAVDHILSLLKHDTLNLRYLNVANNGLGDESIQYLPSILAENTSLYHLDLSRNNFTTLSIDLILKHLNKPEIESNLAFFLLEGNCPLLNERQKSEMSKFYRKSRKRAIVRQVSTNEVDSFDVRTVALNQSKDLHSSGHGDKHHVGESAISGRRLLSNENVSSSSPRDIEGENMITVLFSAPLVFADESNQLHPFAKLDFDMERELMWQCIKESSRDIQLTFDSAHHNRLLATLAQRCRCLHYSGHGHPHFLPFEDGMGGPNWLNADGIKDLIIKDGAAPFEFVFVSACHSGLAGETFASAGVPHVVCCQQEEELKDTAALAFTRSFYLALAVGHTVRESFEHGCKAVRATPNLSDPEKEMEKFVLLPKNGNHDVPVFNAKLRTEKVKSRRSAFLKSKSTMQLGAKSSELGTRNMMQEDPSPSAPQFFIGREVDMYYLLTALLKMKKRLVSVVGEPGIGRFSLVCGLCHYINERASTITEVDRIYFVKPKHGGRNVSCRSLLRQLIDKIREAGSYKSSNETGEVEDMVDSICKSLKNKKALIVFNRTELLENADDAEDFPMILSSLLYDTMYVKIVLTGRYGLGQPSIGGQVEHPYELGPLNVANSVRLFANLCPHLHTPSERTFFSEKLMEDCSQCGEKLPCEEMSVRAREILASVGDGIPARIEKAAYSISKEALLTLRDTSRLS